MFQYERRHQRPLDLHHFYKRFLGHSLIAVGILAFSLLLGMSGYVYFESLSWTDAFLNSAMLLGGMGPVNAPMTEGGKLFAGGYALYAGLIFIVVAGVLAAPVVHRVLHRFHWEEGGRRQG